jgi:hypothetical protein
VSKPRVYEHGKKQRFQNCRCKLNLEAVKQDAEGDFKKLATALITA